MTDETRTTDLSDWVAQCMAEHNQRCRRIAERRTVCKPAIFDVLAGAGITRVLVSFDGSGDSGQIEEITAQSGNSEVPLPDTSISFVEPSYKDEPARSRTLGIKDAIEELVYDALEEIHAGWGDNDGAYGDFMFDVKKRTIELDYNERHMESDNSYHEF